MAFESNYLIIVQKKVVEIHQTKVKIRKIKTAFRVNGNIAGTGCPFVVINVNVDRNWIMIRTKSARKDRYRAKVWTVNNKND